MFAAGCMVLRVFLGQYGTLVAVSVPFMMPLRDSDIPMNVPFTFSNKQPLPPAAALPESKKWVYTEVASLLSRATDVPALKQLPP
jgi:hypothetical protein